MLIARKHIIIVACSMFGQYGLTQSDFGTWIGAEIEAPISKRVHFGLKTQLRFGDNVSQLRNRFISPSISWKANKHLSLGTSYRLSSVPFNSSTSNRVLKHRYTFDLEIRKLMDFIDDKSNVGVSIRLRETTELESQKLTENTLRFKLKFDYNIPKSKLKPYIAGELFYRFNNQLTYTATEVVATNAINKIRLKMGISYKLKKRHSLKFYGMLQKQVLSQEKDFILGVGYSYRLKKK